MFGPNLLWKDTIIINQTHNSTLRLHENWLGPKFNQFFSDNKLLIQSKQFNSAWINWFLIVFLLLFLGKSLVPKPAHETQTWTARARTATAATVKRRKQKQRRRWRKRRKFERRFGERWAVRTWIAALADIGGRVGGDARLRFDARLRRRRRRRGRNLRRRRDRLWFLNSFYQEQKFLPFQPQQKWNLNLYFKNTQVLHDVAPIKKTALKCHNCWRKEELKNIFNEKKLQLSNAKKHHCQLPPIKRISQP